MVKLDDVYADLLNVVSGVCAQIDVPIESEAFFVRLAEEFHGTRDEFLQHIQDNISEWFRCAATPPKWIQEAEWQFSDGSPMVFVGQIDVPAGAGYFHDDASFYYFWSPETGMTKTVIQVA